MNRPQRRLVALLSVAARPLTGLEMSAATGLGPARLYPALTRLREQGKIERVKDKEPIAGTEIFRMRYALARSGPWGYVDEVREER